MAMKPGTFSGKGDEKKSKSVSKKEKDVSAKGPAKGRGEQMSAKKGGK